MDVNSDRNLLRALSTDHAERALEQILHKHGPMVMGVCRRVLGHHHDAEDAFQAAFIVLVRRRHSLVLKNTLGAWLHGVALRIATKAKMMGTQHKAQSQLQEEILATSGLDHTDRVSWSEIGVILDDEIQRLPATLRAAIVLCELEGLSHKDAAQELGIPPGTFSSRVARAKEQLRQRLTRRGVTITSAGITAALSAHASAAPLSSAQLATALYAATLALAGKTASATAAGALTLALADAVGRKMIGTKMMVLAATMVVLLVGVAAAIVFRTPPIANLTVGDTQFVDPLLSAERAVMHLGEEAFRHRHSARWVSYLPNGNRLATISPFRFPYSVNLWDAATGRKLWELQFPNEDIAWPQCLAASPSGSMLAIGRNNGEVSVLDVETGRLLFLERPDSRPVTAITFTPDGNRLVTANMDGIVRISSPDDFGREPRSWGAIAAEEVVPDDVIQDQKDNRGPRASVIAISDDGGRIAIGDGAIGAIYICDAESGERLTTIEKAHGKRLGYPYSCVNTLRFTADGRQLISGGYRMVPRNTTTIDHGANNVQLLEVRLWDVATGELIRDLVDVDIVSEGFLAVSEDGQSFAAADYDRVLHFWQTGDGIPRRATRLPGDWNGEGMAFSPDGTTVAVPTGRGITFWDAHTAERAFHEEPPRYSEIRGVAWSDRANRLAIGYNDGVELRDANTGRLEHRFDMTEPDVDYAYPPGVKEIAFSGDGQWLVAAGQQSPRSPQARYGLIRVWDVVTGTQRANIRIERPVWTMALADDASVVAVTTGHGNSKDTQLSVYELPSGNSLGQFPQEIDSIPNNGKDGFERALALCIPPRSTTVYLACEDNFCFDWNYASRRLGGGFFADQRTDGRASEVRSAVFTPDAKTLVTSNNGKICVWSTKTEKLLHIEENPGIKYWLELGISNDGRRLAGAELRQLGRDDAIRIWDLPHWKLELKWPTPNARATSFAFSPDNTKLLTGLDRGTAVIWDIR